MTDLSDEQIEALLRKYRPLDQRPAPRAAPRVWPWAMAAAALLGLSIGLHASLTPAMPAQASALNVTNTPPDVAAVSNAAVADWLEQVRTVEQTSSERRRERAVEDAWR